ncbi:YeeE/YedE family protein [Oricola cellulosilytica]|uniref:YeeE/YedE family protein n=1 Tax=Oricola cellulosilytica TaxID=1429082 RepID=A0A4R0P536_9HYPH|nr:YeeE/YedE family protein [Oricola cellulosilytica]TCD11961.1 YeeE/YedE family protein [Oricola cellulosilytica]
MEKIATGLATAADIVGEDWTLVLGGALIGALFGAFAQQSRFCLRAATVEFAHGRIGEKTAVWLIVFTTALTGTQALSFGGLLATQEARQIASPQSLSGAALGGLLFGCGMILARGCASRLLVLSATGNLRALLSGLVFAIVAQASLRGFLAPVRESLARPLTTASTGGNDLLALTGIDSATALRLSLAAALVALILATWRRVGGRVTVAAFCVGLMIPAAWFLTGTMSGVAFDPVQVESLSFTGPSADTLMLFLTPSEGGLDFDVGLVPGVFVGAFAAAALTGQLKLEGFHDGRSMRRYLAGASMMGFGGMLAGGCAVGAGVTGASVFALTAWVALFAIWIAACLTHWLVDRPEREPATPAHIADMRPAQ